MMFKKFVSRSVMASAGAVGLAGAILGATAQPAAANNSCTIFVRTSSYAVNVYIDRPGAGQDFRSFRANTNERLDMGWTKQASMEFWVANVSPGKKIAKMQYHKGQGFTVGFTGSASNPTVYAVA